MAPAGPCWQMGHQAGEFCFYKSSTHGWIPAKVLSARSGEQTCDLDVKPGANVESIFRLLDGTVVEYHSQSLNNWIPARVLNPSSEPGSFDLDCKLAVPITKIRPPLDAKGGSPSKPATRGGAAGAFGFGGWWGSSDPDPEPEEKGKGMKGKDGKGKDGKGKDGKGKDGYEGKGYGYDGKGYDGKGHGGKGKEGGFFPNPAGGTTSDVQQDWSWFGGWGATSAPKVSLWRYCPSDGRHLDIRSEPNIDGARSLNCLGAGDVFCVRQEKQGAQGVLYLELADGRGWVFDHKPGFGRMCERFSADEDDGPGSYAITYDKLEVTRARSGSEIVGKLAAGGVVLVLEVSNTPDQQKVRARLESPAGWITLVDCSNNIRYAVKSRKPARSERNACTVWG